jgi:3-phosphoglycerate kinase
VSSGCFGSAGGLGCFCVAPPGRGALALFSSLTRLALHNLSAPPKNKHQIQPPQLLQKELDYLDGAVAAPKRPFAAIVGGSKVSSKITVIESLLGKVDKLFICGGMVFTFLKARGISVGGSLVEDDKLDLARELEDKAKAKGVKLILPVDVIAADKFDPNANTKTVAADAIPDGWLGLDQGPESNKLFEKELRWVCVDVA